MIKALVMRAGSGWGRAMIKQLIGANVEVVAYSGSERKLEALKETFSSSPLLRTVRGDADNPNELLAAAEGVNVVICGVYLTYDDKPEKVRRMLEAVKSVSSVTGARTIILEGVYFPIEETPNSPAENSMRIIIPELYGEGVSNTIIHYALRKVIQGKPVKRLIDPSVRSDYLYVEDAVRNVRELALVDSAYGKQWNLRGNDPISQKELLDLAGSVVQADPRIENRGGWQLRLLKWFEPGAKRMLDQYERLGGNDRVQGIESHDANPTPYQVSIASTVKHMMKKRQGGMLLD